jgi:hypothetical protein
MHAGAPQLAPLSARMHALLRSSSSAMRGDSEQWPAVDSQAVDAHMHESGLAAMHGTPTSPQLGGPVATSCLGSATDGWGVARAAVEADARWKPDYASVAPLIDSGRCVAKVAECGWCVARGCSRKTAVASASALPISFRS